MDTKRQSFAALVAAALLAAGCAVTPSGPSPSGQGAQSDSYATRAGPLGTLTARGLVEALTASDLEILHPVDTTSQECRAAGCQQSIVTDRLRVKSFATTGQAQKYAADRGLMQVETMVVEFAPAVPETERKRYWAEIVQLVSK